jgi:hypothetical protein
MRVSDEERDRRIAAASFRDLMASSLDEGDMSVWYLSFVDTEISKSIPLEEQRPGGPSWLGACIVPAMDATSAVAAAHRLGCNPGGQVAMYGPFAREEFKPECIGVLLKSQQECDEAHV